MASTRDRIILLPRFTTLAGEENFATQPINISAYESGEITVWMGRLVGTGTITAEIEESTDRERWAICGGSSSSALTPQTEQLFTPVFTKAWMRLVIVIVPGAGDDPIATLWATGMVNRRHGNSGTYV